ncbi:Unknown protein [Striga hermonthica]|uniref:Uncharacterized protein n=1 Tax=Striga hermonthica TaxID=68872 RepID=A0A9N7R8L6_STRHE|nr:Unknown protein [Striga hermonthica]
MTVGFLGFLRKNLIADESENSGTENDEEDTYSDAINALSLNESCSVSGVSGSHGTGVRPSGTFSVDKQTRDFMMSRFLPAAKAVVVLETPQYVAKKPSVVGRKDEEIVKVKKNFVSGEITRPLVRKYGSAEVLPYYGRYGFDNEESEDDEDEKIGRVPVKKPGKKWGIIPRICSVKSSMCLLNPLPAMKSKSRPPTPTAGEERRLRRNAVSGPLDKNGRQLTPPPRKKYHSGQISRDLRGPHDTNITNKSSIHDSSYPLLTSRDSPLRRYRSGSVSPYRNESPRSAFREASGFLGVPKEIDPKIASSRKMFNALRDVSRNHAVEKTVYVDSVRKVVEKRSGSKYTDYDEVKKDVKKSLLRPPLPKSPSESWLWRTLPSFGQSRRNSGELNGSSGGDDAKWENIVKSSNIRHDHHACYSEELIPHVSYKQSKS